MFNIEEIFLHSYCQNNSGIYNCLSLNEIHPAEISIKTKLFNGEKNNEIKNIEKETYSIRAEDFKENEILFLSDEENKIINPLRKFDKKNSIFLELGGGNGRFAIKLMKEGYFVIESDIAEGSVNKVKQIAEKNNIKNGIYAIIDAENLPFKNESVDAIFLVASLHHLPNPSIAISEIFRVLKKGGKLLILREPASWHYYFFYPVYKIFKKIIRKKNNKPISLADDVTFGFSKRKIKKLLNPFFKEIKIIPVHYFRKIYTNFILLKSKLFRKKCIENKKIIKFLKTIDDKIISHIPFVNNLSWDWDIYCEK
jgi:ubiquinone/menaquinone biosynthesis C-methylase UbiE